MTPAMSAWTSSRFGDRLSVRYGKALPKELRDSSGRYPVVGSAGVMTCTELPLVEGPAVVIGRKGNVGEARYFATGCWPIDTTYYVVVPEGIDPEYLTHHLRALDLKRLDSSTATPSLRRQDLEAQSIRFPSLTEQRRIVEILEDHLSRLDSASHELSRASRRLLNLDESVLRALVPDDCPSRPLVDLLDAPLTNGRSVPSREGGFPVLRLTALKDAGVDLSERKAGDWSRAEASRFLVQRGDFLVARGNGSLRLVGRGSLVRAEPDEVAFPDTAIRARPRVSDLLPDFLDVMWNSRRTRSQVEAVARTSAGIYKVNQSQLERIELPSLPISFQLRVVEKMDAIDDSRRRLLDTISLAERRQQSMRRSVLAAAFEGKLTGRHTDTEVIDEAASLEGAPR